MNARAILFLGSALLATGVLASDRYEQKADELARFERYAGEPVREIRNFKLTNSEVLSPTRIAVWGRPGEVYLFSLSPPCTELEWGRAIGLKTNLGVVRANSDYVLARSQYCWIETIQKVDERAVMADRRAASRD